MSRKIKLGNQDKYAIVDDWDFVDLDNYKWRLSGNGYPMMHTGGPKESVCMHSVVMWSPPGYEIDHINRNKLDNRKNNLRIVTPIQNRWNTYAQRNSKSGYKGVWWSKERNKWCVQITANKERMNIGRFNKLEDAIQSRKDAEKKYQAIESLTTK